MTHYMAYVIIVATSPFITNWYKIKNYSLFTSATNSSITNLYKIKFTFLFYTKLCRFLQAKELIFSPNSYIASCAPYLFAVTGTLSTSLWEAMDDSDVPSLLHLGNGTIALPFPNPLDLRVRHQSLLLLPRCNSFRGRAEPHKLWCNGESKMAAPSPASETRIQSLL